jgi:predicted Zn-ribbon and HTH transcriptional regulator
MGNPSIITTTGLLRCFRAAALVALAGIMGLPAIVLAQDNNIPIAHRFPEAFYLDNLGCTSICSYEHESMSETFLGTNITGARPQTSTAGVESMDSTHEAIVSALRPIRDQADSALKNIEQSLEPRSMRWKCKECRYTKHFTRPVALEAAGRCPRCKSTELRPAV